MRICVFGATGGVGGHIVRQALDRGDTVTAVVRDPARLRMRHPALTVTVDEAGVMRGSDVVLSAVGARGRHDGPVASTVTRAILGAMKAEGVRRIVVVSAGPVGPPAGGDGFLDRRILRPIVSAVFKDVYADLRAMERVLAESPADWTVVRPPKLVDKPLTGRYRTAVGGNLPRGRSIARADVAHAMLAAAGDPATIGRAVGVAY